MSTGRHRVQPPAEVAAPPVSPPPQPGAVTVYVTVGNSDGRLTHLQWVEFVASVRVEVGRAAITRDRVHGDWHSAPDAPWVNHCWCLEVTRIALVSLKVELALLAATYHQDSIAVAVAPSVEFVRPQAG